MAPHKLKHPELLNPKYRDEGVLKSLARTFEADHAVVLPEFLRPAVSIRLHSVTDALLPTMRHKDFIMDEYRTPRVMSVLGAQDLFKAVPRFRTFYASMQDVVGAVAGQTVFPCVHEKETIVLNRLSGAGKTHGWHLDDPAYALVIVVQGLAPEDGGQVEYIPRWREECLARGLSSNGDVNAAVEALRREGLVRTVALSTGDAYLLRADTSLHRVTEVVSPSAARLVLNLAYQAEEQTMYADTANELYA